jgi:hypothetical protein
MTEERRPKPKFRVLPLAEIVGVAALAIAALSYWDSNKELHEREQAHADEVAEKAARSSFLLKGQVDDKGDRVRLNPVDPDQVVQTVTVWFPKDVHPDKVEIDGDPRLEAAWIADGVRKGAGKSEAKSEAKSEDGRVPVAVQTVFIQDGQTRTDEAVYNLAYSLRHRLLQPDRVTLEGLSLARRGFKGDDPQAAADKLWGK